MTAPDPGPDPAPDPDPGPDPGPDAALVHVTHHRGIVTLTLDSPANRNALSAALVTQLSDALTRCRKDSHVRAVLLTHTGNTFSAGADLRDPPPPKALAETKRQLRTGPRVLESFDEDTHAMIGLSAQLFSSPQAHEGMTAFLERRDPPWVV